MIMLVLCQKLNNFSVTCFLVTCIRQSATACSPNLLSPRLATENYFSPVIFFDSYIQYPGSTSNKVLILDKTQYNTAPSFLQAVESSLENTNNE